MPTSSAFSVALFRSVRPQCHVAAVPREATTASSCRATRLTPLGLVVLATTVAASLSGCAGFHLYDAEREKLAQGAKKSFESADVKATIAAARENQAALAEAEVAQARRLVQVRRNLLLNALAGDDGCEPPSTAPAPPALPPTKP